MQQIKLCFRPDIGRTLKSLIKKMMTKEPVHRITLPEIKVLIGDFILSFGAIQKYVTPEGEERVRRGVTKCDSGGEVLHYVMSRLWNFFFNL